LLLRAPEGRSDARRRTQAKVGNADEPPFIAIGNLKMLEQHFRRR
jgi:hypothetical protein